MPRSTSKYLDVLAGLYVSSFGDYDVEAKGLRFYGTRDVMTQTQNFQKVFTEEDDQFHQVVVIGSQPHIASDHQGTKDVRREDTICELVGGQALLHALIGPESKQSPRYLSVKDVRRWSYLAELLRRPDIQEAAYRLLSARPISFDTNNTSKLGVNISELLTSINPQIVNSLVSHQPNLTFLSGGSRLRGFEFFHSWHFDPLLSLMLIVLPIAYGGIHLAAWNFQFASNVEGLLWKIACIDTMATYLAIRAVETTRNISDSSIWSFRGFFIALCLLLFSIGFNILFFLSRIFLLVESFIGLRHVPVGVYAALPWVQNIPHI